jgi:hypothetical protein
MAGLRIPQSFMLHGQKISVIYEPPLVYKNGNRGEARFSTNQIALQNNSDGNPIPQSSIEQTFCHEMVHYILNEMGNKLKDDERFVDLFASLLHQALVTMEYDGGGGNK